MKKDEILNASRKEHRNKDLAEWKWYIKLEVTQAELVLECVVCFRCYLLCLLIL